MFTSPSHCILPLPSLWLRCVAAIVLVSFVAGAVGIPQIVPRLSADGGRYPCESCSCHCASAEHCWNGCCCHTDQEKLAWARKNGVTPPASFLARIGLTANEICAEATPRPACCAARHAAASCSSGGGQCDEGTEESTSAPRTRWKVVSAIAAAQCGGVPAGMYAVRDASLPTPKSLLWVMIPDVSDLLATWDEVCPEVFHETPEPVPIGMCG